MIEATRAGCTDIQDALSSNEGSYKQLATRTSNILSPQQATSTTAIPANFHQNLNSFQLQTQATLLLIGNSLSTLASAGSTPGPNGGSQLALTPDARACVTATYLCVLIVNNTWLDCNLVEMLCNGNQFSGSSGHDLDKQQDEDHPERLRAIESALDELIVFAGGGGLKLTVPNEQLEASTTTTSIDQGGIHMSPLRFQLELDKSPRPSELHDKGGGISPDATSEAPPPPLLPVRHLYQDNDPLGQLLLYGQTLSEEELARFKLLDGDLNRLTRLTESDRARLVEQYQSLRKDQLSSGRLSPWLQGEQQVSASTNHQDQIATGGASVGQQSITTSNSIVNWVGRPFRGWSSYSFWPSSGEPAFPTNRQEDFHQHQEPKQFHNLRPVEQLNDIATNQSSLKLVSQQQFSANQRPHLYQQIIQMLLHQQQKQPEKPNQLMISELSTPSILGVHNGLIPSTNINSHPYSQIDPQFSGLNQPVSSTFSDLMSVSSSPEVSTSPQFMGQVRSSTTPSAYDFAGTSLATNRQEPDLHSHLNNHHHQQHHHQLMRQQQQQQFQEELSDCKCSEFMEEQNINPLTVAADCRFRCQQTSVTTPSLLESSQPVLISTSFSSSTSVPASPGGKMNPLDVSFLLYTRYHRDLAIDLAATGSAISSVAQPGGATKAISSTDPSNDILALGDLLELTNETTLSESRLNSSLPIKIVIHGFGSGARRPWVSDMVYKLLDYEDANVIVVDWEKGAALPNYVQAAGNTRLVGHKIACLIKTINLKYGVNGNSYHLIGFSLGAHVAGFAGMEIRNSSSVSRNWLKRITGLDPASPLFEGYEANDRLDPSDAQFVDVIHSNGDGVLRGGFGSLQPMGHVDFYPNGGRVQVGCNSVLLSALSDIIYGKWQSLCNHRRALNFFMDSFESSKCRFRSFNCDSYENYLKGECFDCGQRNEKCSYMGYLANYSDGRGKMYLTTHEEAPFCANQFIIKILGSKGQKSHWGKVEVTLVGLDGKNESFWLSSMNQQSSGHDPSGGHKETTMQSLIVAHPSLYNFTQILLRYTKYKGWIYSGDESWSIDKVFITDSDGQVKSFCGFNTVLESHIITRLNLEPGNCTLAETTQLVTQPTPQIRGIGPTSPSGSTVQQQGHLQWQPESQTTPLMPQSLAFQRLAPISDRHQQLFTLNFNNIPFVAF